MDRTDLRECLDSSPASDNASSEIEAGSGTVTGSGAGTVKLDTESPKFEASKLKSAPSTTPSKLKSPLVHCLPDWPKLDARKLKSAPSTRPSRLVSPSSVYFTSTSPPVSGWLSNDVTRGVPAV